MSVCQLKECRRCQYTISLSVPLEKHMSHLLAISIYLAACVWLIWKTQSTCLFLLRNQPLLCNLQALCNPEHTVMERTAKELVWALRDAWFDSIATSFVNGNDTPFSLQWLLLSLPSLSSQLSLLLPSQSGWVKTPKQLCLGRTDSRLWMRNT